MDHLKTAIERFSAIFLLDSFTPSARSALLHQAAAHAPGVWLLRKTMLKAADVDLSDLRALASPACAAVRTAARKLRAHLCVGLPVCRVVHKDGRELNGIPSQHN
jgi:hypothetical protein